MSMPFSIACLDLGAMGAADGRHVLRRREAAVAPFRRNHYGPAACWGVAKW